MASDNVTILRSEYDELVKDSLKLGALEACGVDNWDGYEESLRSLDQSEPDDENEDN